MEKLLHTFPPATLILLIALLASSRPSAAQIAVLAGVNNTSVMHNDLLKHVEPSYGLHLAVLSLRYKMFKNLPSLSFQNDLVFSQKGYRQHLDREYDVRFTYIAVPMLVNYSPVEAFTAKAGIEMSALIDTNQMHWHRTYNFLDLGVVLGIGLFENRRIGLYSRIVYGLMPMLDYYTFDKSGNFTDEVRDVRNLCFSAGIKILLFKDEINFYEE